MPRVAMQGLPLPLGNDERCEQGAHPSAVRTSRLRRPRWCGWTLGVPGTQPWSTGRPDRDWEGVLEPAVAQGDPHAPRDDLGGRMGGRPDDVPRCSLRRAGVSGEQWDLLRPSTDRTGVHRPAPPPVPGGRGKDHRALGVSRRSRCGAPGRSRATAHEPSLGFGGSGSSSTGEIARARACVLGQRNGRPGEPVVIPGRFSAPSPHQRRRVTVRLLPSGPDPVPVMVNR